MNWLWKISAIFALFISSYSHAGNQFFSAAYNQLRAGQFCSRVSYQEIKNAGYTCARPSIHHSASQMLEGLIFREAAVQQADTELCLGQAMAMVKNDAQLLDEWSGDLTFAWLAYKKAELWKKKCQDLKKDLAGKSPGFLETHPPKKGNFTQFQKPFLSDLQKTCFDKSRQKALENSTELFVASIPLFGSEEILKDFEKSRSALLNSKNGKALSDEDILNMDLRKATQEIRLSFEDLRKPMAGILAERIRQRSQVVHDIADSLRRWDNPQIPRDMAFSENMKEYLAVSGTMKSVMLERNLIEQNPATGEITKATTGATCILSWNDKTEKNQAIDTIALFAGGTMSSLYRIQGILRVPLSLLSGAGASAYPSMQSAVLSCGSDVAKASRLKASPGNENVGFRRQTQGLPQDFNYQRFSILLKNGAAPACSKLAKNSKTAPDMLASQVNQSSCIRRIAAELIPI